MQTISTADAYQELVLQEWTDPGTIAAWERWLPKHLVGWRDASERLFAAADIQPGQTVLDLASGTGDPALSVADAVGPSGHVTATDLSPAMLEVCRANAAVRGLTNLDVHVADAQALPFDDATFDRAISKIGVMYFVDLQRALAEVRRVLKPGGRAAFLAWGAPEQSPYIQLIVGPILARVELPPSPPDLPQPFRFAQPGILGPELSRAGFRDVVDELVITPVRWPGPPEELWQYFYDVAVPLRPIIDGLATDERAAAVGEILAGLRRHYDGTHTTTESAFVIASGQR